MTWQRRGQACLDSFIRLAVLRSIPPSLTHARTHTHKHACRYPSEGAAQQASSVVCDWLFIGVAAAFQATGRGENEGESTSCLACEGFYSPIRWLFILLCVVCHVSVILLHSLHLSPFCYSTIWQMHAVISSLLLPVGMDWCYWLTLLLRYRLILIRSRVFSRKISVQWWTLHCTNCCTAVSAPYNMYYRVYTSEYRVCTSG